MPELEGLAASVRGKLRERCARGGYAGRDVVPRVGLADEPLLGFDPAPLLPVAALEVVGPCRLRGNAVDVVGERQERGEATLDSGALPELALDEPDLGRGVEHGRLAPVRRAADAVSADERVFVPLCHVPVVNHVALVGAVVRRGIEIARLAGRVVGFPHAVVSAAEGAAVARTAPGRVHGGGVEAAVGELLELVDVVGSCSELVGVRAGVGIDGEYGARAHVGGPVSAGDEYPALVRGEVKDLARVRMVRPVRIRGIAQILDGVREVGRRRECTSRKKSGKHSADALRSAHAE